MQLPLPENRAWDWLRVLHRRWRGEIDAPPWCRQCGYSVQALETTQCPECGSDLRVVGILDPRQVRFSSRFALASTFVLAVLFISVLLYEHLDFQFRNLPGRYKDWVSAQVWNWDVADSNRGEFVSGHFIIKSEPSPQWRMSKYPIRPVRFVRVFVVDREYEIDLHDRTYRSGGETKAFTPETLKDWLGIPPYVEIKGHVANVIQTTMVFLDSIGDGTITPSGHHGHTIEASKNHGSDMLQIRYLSSSYNTTRFLYKIAYWIAVLLILYLGLRGIRRLGHHAQPSH